MNIMRNEENAYNEYMKKTRGEGCIEDRCEAWNIAWDMLWDAIHATNMTTWRAYDRMTDLIRKAFYVMEPYTDYYFAADDGEWLELEAIY